MRCRTKDLIPTGLRPKTPVHSPKAYRIISRASKGTSQGKDWCSQKGEGSAQSTQHFPCVGGIVSAETLERRTYQLCKEHQISKFNRLKQWKEKRYRERPKLNQLVLNISSKTLTDTQREVLVLGLNLATAARTIQTKDIIARTEQCVRRMKENGQKLRGAKKCLESTTRPPSATLKHQEQVYSCQGVEEG